MLSLRRKENRDENKPEDMKTKKRDADGMHSSRPMSRTDLSWCGLQEGGHRALPKAKPVARQLDSDKVVEAAPKLTAMGPIAPHDVDCGMGHLDDMSDSSSAPSSVGDRSAHAHATGAPRIEETLVPPPEAAAAEPSAAETIKALQNFRDWAVGMFTPTTPRTALQTSSQQTL